MYLGAKRRNINTLPFLSFYYYYFVSDMAVLVLKRDAKLQPTKEPTNQPTNQPTKQQQLLLLLLLCPFNGLFPGQPGKPFWILLQQPARDDGVALASGGPYANRLHLAPDR